MDALGLLLTATGVNRRLERGTVTQDLVWACLIGVLIIGCAVAVTVLLAAALTFAIADRVGDWISASLLAAAVFTAAAAVLGLILRWHLKKTGSGLAGNPGATATSPAASMGGIEPGDLYQKAEAAGLTQPRSLWDIATLVALGFVSALPGKPPPAP